MCAALCAVQLISNEIKSFALPLFFVFSLLPYFTFAQELQLTPSATPTALPSSAWHFEKHFQLQLQLKTLCRLFTCVREREEGETERDRERETECVCASGSLDLHLGMCF